MSLGLRVTNIHDEMDQMEQNIVRAVGRALADSNAESARVAADTIDRLIRMKYIEERGNGNAEDLETFLWQLWDIVIQGAREILHDHPLQDRLVELVSALTEIPPVTVELWESKTCLWTDLPLLGPSMREAWISPTHNNSKPTSDEVVEWINLNAFAARLLNLHAISWTEFAVWELRAALEEPCEGQALECNVVVAMVWIKHAGHILYALAVNTGEDTDILEAANGLFYEGRSMLCLERWEFWKRRFGELGGHLEGNAYHVAFEARKEMEAIERSHKG
ncbi:hypothetical protein F9C07_2285741 [Aspergillus flavus]|uniref:Uncharacterized protein n=2 Tax=Aspergillus flavus TaxID=5059 RepID=B8NJA8_ASPFN|nr:uncharacterized protein G4B84_010135 [Aspergillus flavus NRRL3357]KAB8249336.1 hypothetical protein BDV35DRAFT_345025 [Aspergillus flavus]KAF7621919.1 hypothetical protein AFLA_008469 [Aspergillus flavus NRRL3357]QMW34669.1 hypothetical protein G4B84_010135 [Aspergillus flavus NRRL3357]QRD93506.1 hypothetical protein F9C07_2285741 [Aspergillus flavus]